MPERIKKSLKAVKAQNFYAVLMILGCLLTLFIFYTSLTVKSKYNETVSSMNDYSECSKAIYELRDASDYLIDQVRTFCITKNTENLQNYFYEYNELKRRDLALEILELTHQNDVADVNLKSALAESENLAQIDFYAMKLICEGIEVNKETVPSQIQKIKLSEEDKLLVNEGKLAKANDLLFSTEYSDSKEKITFYTSCAITALINSSITTQNVNDASLRVVFFQQTFFISILFVICIILYIFLLHFVLVPLHKNLLCIQKGAKMKMQGSYEVRYIASAYNSLCDKNAITASTLKHKAEHDPLTGLINRNAFNQIKEALSNSNEPIAYLIIDIDLFKQINDKYGHLVGDEVLKHIGLLLMEQFRATDYVARIGGDEFAVIMTKFGLAPVEIIQRKIDELNRLLQTLEEGMPPVSLSVGVAFSEDGYDLEIEEEADKALYNVKRGGRCNCSFYTRENI